MLLTPRAYHQAQEAGFSLWPSRRAAKPRSSWHEVSAAARRRLTSSMLLVHQAGAVRVGEVVRYTLTYTPAHDRILPTPAALRVKVRNTSAIALRAAYLHGPYALYAACYPAAFDPWKPHDGGPPQFEPNLKAGGSWAAQLAVPENIRETSPSAAGRRRDSFEGLQPSVTWVIEVASQVLFSPNAVVHYEIVVGRDEKSLDFGFAGLVGGPDSTPGQLADHQDGKKKSIRGWQPKGVFSKAIRLKVEDTASLWNKPALPTSEEDEEITRQETRKRELHDSFAKNPTEAAQEDVKRTPKSKPKRKQKRVHLVILSHGLHGNLGADMLYVKESIDAAAKQAKLDRKMRVAQARTKKTSEPAKSEGEGGKTPSQNPSTSANTQEDDDEEEMIVRGYSGNVSRTERGIQYLGKRLAKYVLSFTYPDQPYFPTKKSVGQSISKALGSPDPRTPIKNAAHANSSVVKDEQPNSRSPYKITSISFIGHSLGGLIQTYAIAYIHKHSPDFFERIKPINFVAMASPFLGLSNENPMYVKFALDFGVVGRTGQDLGLTWRAPTIARSGWGAMIAGLGNEAQRKQRQQDPGTKPILRILPSGPAHQVLRLFRNRTVYSNVVNDGVVPLRTSCLLFLDWRGLGRVEKARRENGLVGTMAGWGWAEITGTNATEQQKFFGRSLFDSDFFGTPQDSSGEEGTGTNTPTTKGSRTKVPQPSENATRDDTGVANSESPEAHQFLSPAAKRFEDEEYDADKAGPVPPAARPQSPFAGLINFFKPSGAGKSHHHEPKHHKIYQRGQTIKIQNNDGGEERTVTVQEPAEPRPGMARGDSVLQEGSVYAPPKTTIFESAGDILNPPIPNLEYLTDPSSRPRTIFHDRVYHPDDIPSPPVKRKPGPLPRNKSTDGQESRTSTLSSHDSSGGSSATPSTPHTPVPDTGSMKVEEKIARAYHRDLSWRKVLVRLEPDAHNNMIVRRMFANAYGWPVVRHLVETHFADSYTATTADANEPSAERARPMERGTDEEGREVAERPKPRSSSVGGKGGRSEEEEEDDVGSLVSPRDGGNKGKGKERPRFSRVDSATWDDRFFETDDEDDDQDDFETSRSPRPQERTPPKDVKRGEEDPSLGARRGKDQPHVDVVKPMVAPTLVQSPGGASTMGLRKTIEEQLEMGRRDGGEDPESPKKGKAKATSSDSNKS